MKESPILFNSEMVRAVLSGQKTQTRRVIKLNHAGRAGRAGRNWHLDDSDVIKACPYGQRGDQLWVRETWAVEESLNKDAPSKFSKWPTWFMADDSYYCNSRQFGFDRGSSKGRWRPSIHMPRWASRIQLEITELRAERVQDISNEDAVAEGIRAPFGEADAFGDLWNAINEKRGFGWALNPWVWW